MEGSSKRKNYKKRKPVKRKPSTKVQKPRSTSPPRSRKPPLPPTFTPKRSDTYVFVDGSAFNNSRKSMKSKGGIGVFFGKNDPRNVSEPFYQFPATNNRTELYAVIKALESYAGDKFKTGEALKRSAKPSNLKIFCDSEYVIKSVTQWIKKWKYNGWKTTTGKDVLNKELIVCLDKLLETYGKVVNITFEHVKAHREGKRIPKDRGTEEYYIWYGNWWADRFAVNGSKISIGGSNKEYKRSMEELKEHNLKQIMKLFVQ